MNKDDAIKKIRKLMALAKGGSTENEGETAMRQALFLMREHNIELLEEESQGPRRWDWTVIHVPVPPFLVREVPTWFNVLGVGVGKFTECQARCATDDLFGAGMNLQGTAVDIVYAEWLLTALSTECLRLSKPYKGTTAKNSFKSAYASRVCERMRELKATPVAGDRTFPVVQEKLAARDAEFGPWRLTSMRMDGRDANATAAGRTAGSNASFSRPIGSSGGPRLIGK